MGNGPSTESKTEAPPNENTMTLPEGVTLEEDDTLNQSPHKTEGDARLDTSKRYYLNSTVHMTPRATMKGDWSLSTPTNYKSQIRFKALTTPRGTTAFEFQSSRRNSTVSQTDLFTDVPTSASYHILLFVIDEIKTLQLVSPEWYSRVNDSFDEESNAMENRFATSYVENVLFKRSLVSSGPIRLSAVKGIRVDRAIAAEILPSLEGKTFKFGYKYKLIGDAKSVYLSEFVFDVTGHKSRGIWIHKDESNFHSEDGEVYANTQKVITARVGDNIEFAINVYSRRGIVDLNSIEWLPGTLIDLKESIRYSKSYFRSLNKNKKMDLEETQQMIKNATYTELPVFKSTRQCELELTENDWVLLQYYPRAELFAADLDYGPLFKVLKIEGSGVDIPGLRVTLATIEEGIMEEAMDLFGFQVFVVSQEESITVEVKRMGLLMDRYTPLQLRVGDILTVYISRGGQGGMKVNIQ